jgi:hypothetical protein
MMASAEGRGLFFEANWVEDTDGDEWRLHQRQVPDGRPATSTHQFNLRPSPSIAFKHPDIADEPAEMQKALGDSRSGWRRARNKLAST